MKVSGLMSKELCTVYAGDTAQKATEEMAKHNRGLLAVYNDIKDKEVIGVLSNKDIINKIIAKKISPETVFVKDIMTKGVISLSPDKTTSDAMALMREHQIKRILVIENSVLQGIISSNDILEGMVKYKKELLDMAIDF
ncbi:CBS domain-containing protein [Candidatus Woesearchaeota archaeon]|nr:CBS domain-containing protein [Candidatus Woesearchaeota archaeon]